MQFSVVTLFALITAVVASPQARKFTFPSKIKSIKLKDIWFTDNNICRRCLPPSRLPRRHWDPLHDRRQGQCHSLRHQGCYQGQQLSNHSLIGLDVFLFFYFVYNIEHGLWENITPGPLERHIEIAIQMFFWRHSATCVTVTVTVNSFTSCCKALVSFQEVRLH